MGTNERLSDEGPQHVVHLKSFYIDKYEVTNLQYKKFIDETGRRSPKHFRNRTYPQGKVDHPVTFVTWYDAKDYCEWAGKRLPTDEEWEKAARGTDARTYPWGSDFGIDRANTPQRWAQIKQEGDTSPVGAFEKGVSPYGVYDMSGNVWEWTSSWYEAYPGNKTASENYGEHYKTLKGGSWFDCSFYKCGISAPVYNRSFFALKVNNDTFGFRCTKDTDKKKKERNRQKNANAQTDEQTLAAGLQSEQQRGRAIGDVECRTDAAHATGDGAGGRIHHGQQQDRHGRPASTLWARITAVRG